MMSEPKQSTAHADAYCIQCGQGMTGDEAALNNKLVNRMAKEFLCPSCLGERLGTSAETLRDMITVYRKQGCRFFSPWVDGEETQEK